MRSAFAGMNAPGRFLVAVERVRNRPSFLIEIRARVYQRNLAPGFRARLESEQLEFAEMKIAVARLPAGAALRKAIVRENFQTHGRDLSGGRTGCERINIAFRRSTSRKQRIISFPRKRRSTRRDVRLRFDDFPSDFTMVRAFEGRDVSLRLGAEQNRALTVLHRREPGAQIIPPMV